jgi:hypothetical protein
MVGFIPIHRPRHFDPGGWTAQFHPLVVQPRLARHSNTLPAGIPGGASLLMTDFSCTGKTFAKNE